MKREPRLFADITTHRARSLADFDLTQAFKRSEGVPPTVTKTQLRLGRALAQLPDRDDITDLALDLGFYKP
jgi:AraC-like DNA-binding protein